MRVFLRVHCCPKSSQRQRQRQSWVTICKTSLAVLLEESSWRCGLQLPLPSTITVCGPKFSRSTSLEEFLHVLIKLDPRQHVTRLAAKTCELISPSLKKERSILSFTNLHPLFGDHAFILELFRIQFHHSILFGDILVHDWLCKHGIIPFIVAVATITNLKISEDTSSTP